MRLDLADKIVQATAEDSARVTITVFSIDQAAVGAVSEGDELVWEQENCDFGSIVHKEVANAVKYNTSGGTIEVSLKEEDLFLTLRIRDYGIGIEPDEENRIFQRFYRGHRVTTQEGFGIGLYLAREIVSQHGGILTVKRKEPGVEMRLSIPRT